MGAGAAIGVGAAGLGLQAKGILEAGKAARRQAKAEREWYEYNAKIKQRAAEEQQEAAAAEERKHRKAGERKKARMITQAGQAGIEPIGSFEEVFKETASEIEEDALTIRRGGTLAAQSLRAGAELDILSGRSALRRGREAVRASKLAAWSTALGGGSDLAFQASG